MLLKFITFFHDENWARAPRYANKFLKIAMWLIIWITTWLSTQLSDEIFGTIEKSAACLLVKTIYIVFPELINVSYVYVNGLDVHECESQPRQPTRANIEEN